MKITVTCGSVNEIACDLLVVNEFEGVKVPGGATGSVDKALGGMIAELSMSEEITGKIGTVPVLHTCGKIKAKRVAVAGLGSSKEFDLDKVRIVSAAVIRKAKDVSARKVATIVHGAGIGGLNVKAAAEAVVIGSLLAAYRYSEFKTADKKNNDIEELIIVDYDPQKVKEIQQGAKAGEIIASAANRTRDLVNAPSNKTTPTYMAEYSKKLASACGLSCEVLDRDQMEKLGMKSLLAVAMGSKEPPKLVVLKYEPKDAGGGKVGLIGKGITFDAGGISLKPSKAMSEMKTDMSGAAAVIETMGILKDLGVSKSVTAVIPLTENMPDGGAFKPGDIIGSMEGKNVEIISTDAEGRMILSDALTYARKLGAQKLIDIATLTGGCARALGDVASGVFGNDQSFVDEILAAGERSGERCWQLPLYEEYKEYFKSDVADFTNCSEDGKASPSVAALYLKEFVGDLPWVHIDIAGTAFNSREISPSGKGATAVGVRLLVSYLKGD